VKDSPVPVLAGDSGTTISTSARVAGQSSGSGSKESSPAPTGWRAKWQEILAEAEKQKTIQNENRKKDQAQNKGKNKPNKGKR
jgi:hypothetical protein